MKKWIIKNPDKEAVNEIVKGSDLSKLCAEVLVSRNISSLSQAGEFIKLEELESPFLMKDMQEAVDIITNAVDAGKSICVYGDYDCDGITSTAILYSYLECIGANVCYYIPERSEGYGMNSNSIKKLYEKNIELIITVDNGISAHKEAELIKELGMTLIITDHHQQGESLPDADAIINPHRHDCPSIFKTLCGAGVALKLIAGLEGGDYTTAMEQFGDLACIGTIADIVNLTGENRYIVDHGLRLISNTERVGLIALIEKSGCSNRVIDAGTIGFTIAPRINAAGRFGSPTLAVKLLLSDNEEEAKNLAGELDSLNVQRKETENIIMGEINKQIMLNPEVLHERVLIFSGEDWHHGVIGIVASRIEETYGKPCFIITMEGKNSRGSARSFGEFSIFKCLEYCKETMIKYGGHMGAGGFSLETKKIPELYSKIQEFAYNTHKEMPPLTITADKSLSPTDLTVQNVLGLTLLEPFGEGNPQPVFALLNAEVIGIYPISNGLHTKLKVKYANSIFDALLFRVNPQALFIREGEFWNFLVTLNINKYNNNTNISFYIKDFRKNGIKQSTYLSAKATYEAYKRKELLPANYYKSICPTREELVYIYKNIPTVTLTADILFMLVTNDKINYCKFKLCLDIFCELKFIEINPCSEEIKKLTVTEKTNIENSNILKELKSYIND